MFLTIYGDVFVDDEYGVHDYIGFVSHTQAEGIAAIKTDFIDLTPDKHEILRREVQTIPFLMSVIAALEQKNNESAAKALECEVKAIAIKCEHKRKLDVMKAQLDESTKLMKCQNVGLQRRIDILISDYQIQHHVPGKRCVMSTSHTRATGELMVSSHDCVLLKNKLLPDGSEDP